MVNLRVKLPTLLLIFALAACSANQISPSVMSAPSQEGFPTTANLLPNQEYRIGPLDELSITVFQEEDLSLKDVPVDQ